MDNVKKEEKGVREKKIPKVLLGNDAIREKTWAGEHLNLPFHCAFTKMANQEFF